MKKLLISLVIFTSTLTLGGCACNGGCDYGFSNLNLFSSGCCASSSNCSNCSSSW